MNTTALGRVIPFPQPSKSAKLKRGRPTDAAQGRTRSSLTPGEVAKLIKAARSTGRYGHRDATLILLAYRHGLRVSELIAMRWDQVDFHQGLLAVVRRERGVPSMHPLSGTELRALRRLKREQPRPESRHGFQTERGGPLSASTVRHVVRHGQGSWPVFRSRCNRTGYGIRRGTSWRMLAPIHERCSITLGIGTSSTW